MRRTVTMFLILVFACGVGACARQPKSGHAVKLIQRYFMHYGKKYQASPFGQSPVTGVTAQENEEIHKRYVATTAQVAFQDGRTEAVRCSIEHSVPAGWRIVSWERLGVTEP